MQTQRRLWLGDKPTRKVKANIVYQGDNLEIMRELEPNKIQLIYIDPPFCAQNVFKSKAWNKKIVSFNDEWGGGIQSYIRWLVPRLRECYRLLSPTGVFCLHLDQRSSHYAKVELDKIFGYKNFMNEIIWCYGLYSRGAKAISKSYARNSDTILVYKKSNSYKFKKQTHLEKFTFENARRKGFMFQENRWFKITTRGDYTDLSIEKFKKEGRIYITKNGTIKIKYYLKSDDEFVYEEKKYGNVWIDINDAMHISKKEKLGYPTQKPLKLLDRFIKTFTDKNDMVFDSFCGCGTTISSAQNLGRQWLGIDISKDAISVIRKRMEKEHSLKIKVINTGAISRAEVYELDPFEFEKKMVKMIGGTPNLQQRGDGGIDGRCYDHTPIQVKKSFNVGRPIIDSFYKHVKGGNGRGVIIARSFSKGAYEECNRLYNKEGLLIDLVPSDDIIRDAS